MEKIAESKTKVAYKDFAHSPSKVAATTKAVKEQYPNRTLVACFELHTYSSLNAEFLKEYHGILLEIQHSNYYTCAIQNTLLKCDLDIVLLQLL